jgi:drug/metabolite transporter (DMT)-like permease
LYYLFLASAIQRAGGALPTMIIGTLPVVIAVSANLLNHQRDGRFPWLKLAPPLALILAGIACVNHVEWTALQGNPAADTTRYLTGAVLAVGAVVCWTWYPLKNADWLRGHPDRNPRVWATAQGIATLPLAVLGYAAFWLWTSATHDPMPMPLGPRPLEFIGLMMAIGLFASWLGTLCWNAASQRLPTALAGQLIVFETLAALSYAFWLRGQWPEPLTLTGIALLVAGVIGGVRVKAVEVSRTRPSDGGQ